MPTDRAGTAGLLLNIGETNAANAALGNAVQSPTHWGLIPYWNNLPSNPIHEPSAVYLNIYWIDLKPTENAPLTKDAVLAAVEKRLGRPLKAPGPQVVLRFIATGDMANNRPLPQWFKPTWRAPAKCETEKGQQLPAWTDPAQLRAHSEIVKALAAALDGHSQVAWIEPGSYGFWGEGHLDGAPVSCIPCIEIRAALAQPWVESFRRTPLSVTMDWIRSKDDPHHWLRDLWGRAASIGLRFDCLGFWHDEYASVIASMAEANVSGWDGPWGGEFCWSERGSKWAMGYDNVSGVDELRKNAPPLVAKMKGQERRNRVLGVVSACRWSYVAGAGSSLLERALDGGAAALALEAAMTGPPRDLRKCAMAARVGQ